jgi:predicted ATPase
VLAHYAPPDVKSHIVHFQIDQLVAARTFLGRILWLQGFPDQAMAAVERAVEEARASQHVVSLCFVLAHSACQIALWTGDLGMADQYVELLVDLSTKHSLARWRAFGLSHRGALAIKRGDLGAGLQRLTSGLGELGETNSSFRFSMYLCDMVEALGRVGRAGQGLSSLDEAIARADETEERWCIAELLRIKGELLLLQGAAGAAATAEDHFRRALDLARRQGALSWELRAATSLARLRRDQGRPADALAFLQPVYDRFTEGFDTADLKATKALLRDLG